MCLCRWSQGMLIVNFHMVARIVSTLVINLLLCIPITARWCSHRSRSTPISRGKFALKSYASCSIALYLINSPTSLLIFSPLSQDSEPITAVALSPDKSHVFAASRSLQMKCWSVETGKAVKIFRVRL
jgi:WD40 repeat protein